MKHRIAESYQIAPTARFATMPSAKSGLNPDIALAIYCGLTGYCLESFNHYNNYF
jgi:hypothetical protein